MRPLHTCVPHALLATAIAAAFGCQANARSDNAGQGTVMGARKSGGRVTRTDFGALPNGDRVQRFILSNGRGLEVEALTYGAIIQAIRVPDRRGRADDVALGFDSLSGYLTQSPYFGAVVGRYANRIAAGRFTLDGVSYTLARNNGPNALHGGVRGFDKVIWSADSEESDSGAAVSFRYTSPDGEEGYPGEVSARVTYRLTPHDELIVEYEATTTKATPINLSQHTYWNLHGAGNGDILDHMLTLRASAYTPVDSTLIPTGQVAPVSGTPFDFRAATRIGARIDEPDEQLLNGRGYDHNLVFDRPPDGTLVHVAKLADSTSGRTLDISTTELGVQFYTGNFLDGTIAGKGGRVYGHRSGVCLETQHFPDSPNRANFPSTILRPGDVFRSRTVFGFGVMR